MSRFGWRRVGAGLVMAIGVGMIALAVLVLVVAFLPNAGMAAAGVLVVPFLAVGGGMGLVSGLAAWRGSRGGRWASIAYGGVLALLMALISASALGIGRPSPEGGCITIDKGPTPVEYCDTSPAEELPPDVATATTALVVGSLSLAASILLLAGWGRFRRDRHS